MLVCLDTSVIIALIRRDQKAVEKLREAVASRRRVSTTVVSLCELYAGAYGSRDPMRELEKVQGLASLLDVLHFGVNVAKKYGELANSQSMKGKPIGDFDMIIASTSLLNEEPLATRDVEHFSRVPGLEVEVW